MKYCHVEKLVMWLVKIQYVLFFVLCQVKSNAFTSNRPLWRYNYESGISCDYLIANKNICNYSYFCCHISSVYVQWTANYLHILKQCILFTINRVTYTSITCQCSTISGPVFTWTRQQNTWQNIVQTVHMIMNISFTMCRTICQCLPKGYKQNHEEKHFNYFFCEQMKLYKHK
jgi:hypothetical protein